MQVRPSNLRKQSSRGQYDTPIGEGLFSKLAYRYNDVIAVYTGTWRSPYEVRRLADEVDEIPQRRLAYCLHWSSTEWLDCYDEARTGSCIASKANDARLCKDVTTYPNYSLAKNNCRIVKFLRKSDGSKFFRLKAGPLLPWDRKPPANYVLPADTELLASYSDSYTNY